jgi:hypothetical protein
VSRLDDWLEANRPVPPSVPITESVETYERAWAEYNVAARAYQAKIREIVRRHAAEIAAAIPRGLKFVDGVPDYTRTFELHDRKE